MRRRVSRAGILVALALAARAAGRAEAAVLVDTSVQESAFNSADLALARLTIGTGAKRLIVVGVAIAKPSIEVSSVRWEGTPLERLDLRTLTGANGSCRQELWYLVDPAPGNHPLLISLSGMTAFGVGAVVYAGVDQTSPLGPPVWAFGNASPIALDVVAAGDRPVLGAACLGGPWTTGRSPTAAAAAVGPGELSLWDYTEPSLVGVGTHRLAANGKATVRWDVTSVDPFAWAAVGLAITPDGELAVDAGADAPGDLGVPDAVVDQSVPEDVTVVVDAGIDASPDVPPDASPETPEAAPEAPDAAIEASSRPPADAALDLPPPVIDAEADGTTFRAVNLRVGCACRIMGSASPVGGMVPVGLVFVFLLRRRRPR